jgi:hypothetical protein
MTLLSWMTNSRIFYIFCVCFLFFGLGRLTIVVQSHLGGNIVIGSTSTQHLS